MISDIINLKFIRLAMLKNDIATLDALAEASGLSYGIIKRITRGDGTAKLIHTEKLLNFLGYKLAISASIL